MIMMVMVMVMVMMVMVMVMIMMVMVMVMIRRMLMKSTWVAGPPPPLSPTRNCFPSSHCHCILGLEWRLFILCW